ncbi:MAG: hypothetical protein KGI67_04315 [Pseudomonadota bacterium]|nr:hypothetical protein [Pseudomonadota bacterium]
MPATPLVRSRTVTRGMRRAVAIVALTLPLIGAAAGGERPWLLFGLGSLARERLHAAQMRVRELQASRGGHDRTQVSLQIEQQDLLPRDQTFAGTRWEAWLRSSREEGFYPIWTGTVRDLASESRAGF